MSDSEIRDLIRTELSKALKQEIAKYVKAAIKNGDLKKDVNLLIKKGLEELVKFLFIRKSVWQNEIGK